MARYSRYNDYNYFHENPQHCQQTNIADEFYTESPESIEIFESSIYDLPAVDPITEPPAAPPPAAPWPDSFNGGAYSGNLDYARLVKMSFDADTSAFPRVWGAVSHGVTAGGDGYLQVTSPASTHENAVAMVAPTGPDAGFGYGLFSFTLSVMIAPDGLPNPGPYAVGWPGSDVWPGPEIDAFEIGGSVGNPTHRKAYSVLHHKRADGGDGYEYQTIPTEIDTGKPHTYSFDWKPDSVTFLFDGRPYKTITENVPLSFADGGENIAPGVGNITGHWLDQNPIDNWLRLYEFNYMPYQGVEVNPMFNEYMFA